MTMVVLGLLLLVIGVVDGACRQVEMEETEVCEESEDVECGSCSTVHTRECRITMMTSWSPVKIRRCPSASPCPREGREFCRIDYKTRCSSTLKYHSMKEDYPRCSKKKVISCSKNKKREQQAEWLNLIFQPATSTPLCQEVERLSCKIETRTVRKAKPVTRCNRLPRKMCYKKKCKQVQCSTQ